MTEQKPHDVSALARQWVDAETLCDFLKTRAESIRVATQGTETSGKPISEMSFVEIAVLTLRGNTDLQAALAEAKRGISDEVVAGRIYCIGRRRDSLEFEKVPRHSGSARRLTGVVMPLATMTKSSWIYAYSPVR